MFQTSVVVTIHDKDYLRKEGVFIPAGLRMLPIMVGQAWSREPKVAASIASASRCTADFAQLTFLCIQ